MRRFQTAELITELQKQTESFLHKAVSEWQLEKSSKLLQPPGENMWSAAQCLEHLNSYGHYYLPAIEKSIAAAKGKKWAVPGQYRAGWLGEYFTNLMAPDTDSRKMKKMSAPKGHVPAADLDSDKVLRVFIDQQETMLSLLEQAGQVNIEKAKVPVSLARFIRLQLGDTFRFLVMHTYRHVLQAERALAAVKEREEAII